MRAWFRRGATAARIAGDRADLWPAGALAWLAYAGWLPLLLVLAQPDPNGLAAVGVSLYTSSSFPANVLALAVAAVAGFGLLCFLAALAEVSLQRGATRSATARQPVARATLTVFSVVLVASLPAALAFALLLTGLLQAAPGEFQSPDVATPVLVRLASDVVPLLVLLLAVLLLVQSYAGIAVRRAMAEPHRAVTRVMIDSAADLLHRPLSRIGLAGAALVIDVVMLLLTFALLRILWQPIAAALTGGRLAAPDTLLLLLGFVAIWLVLLLVAGAIHVAGSAWWAAELARGDAVRPTSPANAGIWPIGAGRGDAR